MTLFWVKIELNQKEKILKQWPLGSMEFNEDRWIERQRGRDRKTSRETERVRDTERHKETQR